MITRRRRLFYEWMNSTGASLKEPIPGSTNYLGAYDKFGNLVRAAPGWQRDKVGEKKVPEKVESETLGGQEVVDELEMSVRRDAQKKSKPQKEDDNALPPETAEDLRPFPMNKHFRSQPVLSEDLREAIYQRVKRDGATVSLASVEFGVSNERVGAVVRLKQLEKEWIAQVRLKISTSAQSLDDETLYKSISLEDIPHG
jgi:hypothetical protein